MPCRARVHHILRGDKERHLHDHPSWSISILLRGSYVEEMPLFRDQDPIHDEKPANRKRVKRRAGAIVFRRATDRHRILDPINCWSLFIMGRKTNEWGFFERFGKIPWRTYLDDFTTQSDSD